MITEPDAARALAAPALARNFAAHAAHNAAIRTRQVLLQTPYRGAPSQYRCSGDLRVEGLYARYSTAGPLVLQDVSFQVKSGERVGIVGRTGSGKSSLMLSLMRAIPIEGRVYYDGVDTNQVNLDALRGSITVIPQVVSFSIIAVIYTQKC